MLAYEDGNFVDATSFTADIGPFRTGSHIAYLFSVRDSAGNVAMTDVAEIIAK